ncbi:MAG: NCS1 family nucleobase:cation symporter-1 [Cyanobacteria bacterium]|nr:NCS1 family nucleobase:cation symporter-1 [Cyanobacteriota bacterium]
MQSTLRETEDGKVELVDNSSIIGSPLYNHDLAPVPVEKRDWSMVTFAALWMSMSANIATYMLASGLMTQGMNCWQALTTIFLGNVLVLIPILLNSHPGPKYGIPFPVFARAAYGTYGSNLPALMRAVVACGWFGIQAWIGGQALDLLLASIIPGWKTLFPGTIGAYPPTTWISFAAFWCLNILVIFKGMGLVRRLAVLAAPFVFIMTSLLVVWAVTTANGLGNLLSRPGQLESFSVFFPKFIPALSAVIGCWATLSLNMPDFTRFGRSQRESTIGQSIALPLAMTAYSGMGVVITSAAMVIYPKMPKAELWDPIKLAGQFDQSALVAAAMLTICVATLSVNIAANVVSPANDFANAFPRWISFKKGAVITGIAGVAMQPWHILSDANAYIFQWLQGYSGGLGSIAGVLIVDYWMLRKKQLNLKDLYSEEGSYTYARGWNWKAVIATVLGCVGAWIGLVVPQLKTIYDYAWFVGVGVAAISYYFLMIGEAKKLNE